MELIQTKEVKVKCPIKRIGTLLPKFQVCCQLLSGHCIFKDIQIYLRYPLRHFQ